MKDAKWKREALNPLEVMRNVYKMDMPEHIKYDPSMRWSDRQYYRGSSESNDGTLSLTINCLARCLEPLLKMESYHIPSVPTNTNDVVGIRYTIGKIYHATVFGMVDLRCGKYPGQRESFRIPVVCEFIMKGDKL